MICINKNLPEYQTKLKMSGIQEDTFEAYSSYYLERFGRFPNLDELPNSDSSEYIKDIYNVKDNLVKNENLERQLGTSEVTEQIVKLNKMYTDKLIDLHNVTDDYSIIDIIDRPTSKVKDFFPKDFDNVELNVINTILEDLAKYSGIQFRPVTNKELINKTNIPNSSTLNAFVENGIIYINTDNLKADSPIHEMLHIFLGGIKYTSPNLYNNLLEKIIQLPNYKVESNKYKNRVQSDIAEELLVTEYSKYLTHQNSIFDNLSEIQMHELNYQIKRILDTAIFGDISIKAIPDNELFGKTLLDIAKLVNSDLIRNQFSDIWKNSKEHRGLNNAKSELLKSGELKEEC